VLREQELTGLRDDVDLDRDRALVERCQAGDSAAFGNLYARYYERLLRFCLRRLNDRHEAEDAAQEAFARAWKALPRFAGERRFYPWLTVIAGNICTDTLRLRSRSMPTDDIELTAQRPVGVVGEDTFEELVLAAVDGELVNRALGRLSTRHRHVLSMREGSGWTYQQIADHEGVEIGTIETLLWRARQALKREFAVVSDAREALAGFLIATGALIRRTVFRTAHRGATVHNSSGGGSGAVRNAVAGVAVTAAAVTAAFIAPHALSSDPGGAASAPGSALAAPPIALGSTQFTAARVGGSTAGPNGGSAPSSAASGNSGSPSESGGSANARSGATSDLGGALASRSSSGSGGVTAGLDEAGGGLNNTVSGATGGLGQTVSSVTGGVAKTVGGVTGTVGSVVGGLSSTPASAASGVNGLTQAIGLGTVLAGTSGSGSSGSASSTATTTTATTNPVQSVLGGTTKTVGGLLGG